jgi:hypothetical protein
MKSVKTCCDANLPCQVLASEVLRQKALQLPSIRHCNDCHAFPVTTTSACNSRAASAATPLLALPLQQLLLHRVGALMCHLHHRSHHSADSTCGKLPHKVRP